MLSPAHCGIVRLALEDVAMVTTMALSESLSKFVDKVNENVSKLKEREYIQPPDEEEETDGRPASPFFLLLSEGGEEFNLNNDGNDPPTPPPPPLILTTRAPLHQVTTPTVIQAGTMSPVTTARPKTLTPMKTPLHTTPLEIPTPVHKPAGTTTFGLDRDSVSFSTCNSNHTISLHYSTNVNYESSNVDAPDTMDGSCHSSDLKEEESTISKSPPQLLTKEEFDRLFDHSGRLVNEHELRQTIFKNGIHDDVRKQVWQFLFELYPFNTTAREREILKVEQTVRYEAMKIRWKKLLKTLVNDYEGVAYCPKWFTGCTKQKSMPKTSQLYSREEEGEDKSVKEEVKQSGCTGQAEAVEQENLEPSQLFLEPSQLFYGVSDNSRTDVVVGELANEIDDFKDKDSVNYGFLSETPDINPQPDHSTPDEHPSPLSETPPSLPAFCALSPDTNHSDYSIPNCYAHSQIEPISCSTIAQDPMISVDDNLGNEPSSCDRTLMTEAGNSNLSRRLSSGGNVCIEDTESPSSHIENAAEHEDSNPNSLCEDSCDCEQLNDSLTVSEERLEKLPPWIVQMINASTLPSHKCKKNRLKSKQKANTTKYPCDDFIRAMDEDITKRRELLGIVENANRFLKERKNIINTTNSRTVDTSHVPSVEKQGEVNELETVKVEPDPPPDDTPSNFFGCDQQDFEVVVRVDDVQGVDCPYCDESEDEVAKITLSSSVVGEDQLKFMQVQAQIYAARQSYDPNKISESVRVIDKDVPRTDRELETFSGNDNIHLVELRDALLTYAFFNPDVGYAQGMNDIMARFLVVMKKESEAYWMFVRYMDHFKHHFMEEGMLEKITLVEQLLLKMDKDLHDYLHSTDMGLMFCHRWLLLNFKREFEYHESLRIFEITSSRHLEVSSLQAELERCKQRAEEFVQGSAGSHLEEVYISPEIPFDIFICVAMLMECRDVLMATSDVSRIYEILSNLPHTLDLENILEKSEQLFYQYCRRTVVDCFQVIDDVV